MESPVQSGMIAWRISSRTISLGPPPVAPLIMGIVNTTPDSFSDGGRWLDAETAVKHALTLVEQGADIIDVGGESTRPGAEPVPADLELGRVLPVIERLHSQSGVLISIDTSKASVARAAIAAGASIINDVTALRLDPEMIEVAAHTDAAVIAMHMIGTPQTMQQAAVYADVVGDVRSFLEERLNWLEQHGVARERVAIDPGIGFAKTSTHNLELIRRLGDLASLGRPICLGASRKGFIGKVLDRELEDRVIGTAATSVVGYLRGAHILRVHDVAATRDATLMVRAIEQGHWPP